MKKQWSLAPGRVDDSMIAGKTSLVYFEIDVKLVSISHGL